MTNPTKTHRARTAVCASTLLAILGTSWLSVTTTEAANSQTGRVSVTILDVSGKPRTAPSPYPICAQRKPSGGTKCAKLKKGRALISGLQPGRYTIYVSFTEGGPCYHSCTPIRVNAGKTTSIRWKQSLVDPNRPDFGG